MFGAFRHTRLVLASCRPQARCCAAHYSALKTQTPRRTLKRRSRPTNDMKPEELAKCFREALEEHEKKKWDAMPWYKKYVIKARCWTVQPVSAPMKAGNGT